MSPERKILTRKFQRREVVNGFMKVYEKVLDGIDKIQGREII